MVVLHLGCARYRRLRHRTLRVRKAAIRKRLKMPAAPTTRRRIDAFLRGAEKINSSGPQLCEMPVTTQHLHLLYQRLDLQHRQGSAPWASALLTSFLMPRASNVVVAFTSSYDPSCIICRRDVTFHRDDSATSRVQLTPKTLPLIQRMEITIKKFKTEQHTRGFTNILQRISHPCLIVVKTMAHHQLLINDMPTSWPGPSLPTTSLAGGGPRSRRSSRGAYWLE